MDRRTLTLDPIPTRIDRAHMLARLSSSLGAAYGVAKLSVRWALTVLGTLAAAALLATRADAANDRDSVRAFLEEAAIVETTELDVGVTHSKRVLLDDGDLRHLAHVQTIDQFKDRHPGRLRAYRFRDSYKYNVAASVLDDALGLGMVPVSVERRIGTRKAAFTWWVDDVQMMERDRIAKGTSPAKPAEWIDQLAQAKIFSALIANDDFNATNMLITSDWKLWLVDFTRAFRLEDRLADRGELDPNRLPRIDRRFWQGLLALDRETAKARLDHVLTKPEIDSLMNRRDEIVELYAAAIGERGEDWMICDRPGH